MGEKAIRCLIRVGIDPYYEIYGQLCRKHLKPGQFAQLPLYMIPVNG